MGKTWKDQKVRNYAAKELWTKKYRSRVIPNKRKEATEAEVLDDWMEGYHKWHSRTRIMTDREEAAKTQMLKALQTTDLTDSEIAEVMEAYAQA